MALQVTLKALSLSRELMLTVNNSYYYFETILEKNHIWYMVFISLYSSLIWNSSLSILHDVDTSKEYRPSCTVSLILDLSDVSCWFDTDYGFLADRVQKWYCIPQGAPYQEAYNIDLSHCRWCTHCSLHSGAVRLLYFLFELINNLRGYTLRICKYLVIIFLLIKCNIHWWILPETSIVVALSE